MVNIDFSCKHDIMIENPDGSLSHMDEPFFQSELIAPGTWKILSDGDFQYLLAGDGEALVIDTGYGAGNLREYCEQLCGLPVRWAANTHEHFDHSANNGYFDLVYMTAKAHENATVPYASFAGIDFPRNYPVQHVKTGDIIPLAGRPLEVFEIADHTPGGAVFLDRKERILFSGDEIWARKPLNNSAADFAVYLEKIVEHEGEFDILWAGNGSVAGDVPRKQLENCRKIMAGDQGKKDERRGGPPPHRARPDGKVVYMRQRPHHGDNAGNLWGKPRPDISKMRFVETDGVAMMFVPEEA